MYTNQLFFAREFAKFAHYGQEYYKDGPNGYLDSHLSEVAASFVDEKEIIVSYLHDILEDTQITYETLKNVFGKEIADYVDCLTRKHNENYFDYIRRVNENEFCRKIKIADILCNLENAEKNGREMLIPRYISALGILEK